MLKAQQLSLQGNQINNTNRIVALHVSGTFAGIKYCCLFSPLFMSIQMGMAMQSKLVLVRKVPIEFQWIMYNNYSASSPDGCKWGLVKIKAMFGNSRFQGVAFLVIVAKDAGHRRIQVRKNTDGFGLRDITSVHHMINVCCVEQLNDPGDVFQIVVGIADHANTHAAALVV
jgi:hypothetical protein